MILYTYLYEPIFYYFEFLIFLNNYLYQFINLYFHIIVSIKQ